MIGDCSFDKASNLVPIITETAIGIREQITVFGDDYNTKDGTCLRDYIHVIDLANAHIKALEYVMKYNNKSAFNIGTGNGVSVLEAIHIFEQVNDLKVNYKIGPRRVCGDVEQIYSDNTLSTDELKWEAKRTIEEAMSSAWLWENRSSNGNKYMTKQKTILFVTPQMSGFVLNDLNIIKCEYRVILNIYNWNKKYLAPFIYFINFSLLHLTSLRLIKLLSNLEDINH